MNWQRWAYELRQNPQQGVADLLRGAADIGSFERVAPHEFLLAVLPRNSRSVSPKLLGEAYSGAITLDAIDDLPTYLDAGLSAWLLGESQAPLPPARKLSAYAAQVCEALQWPLYFVLPQTRAVLRANRARWLKWLASLTLSAYRDPEYDYWQVLASQQYDGELQFFWQSFVVEAGRTRSMRYLNFGLLALAKLPLTEDDSLHNLRLQVQALINRYQRRKGWGTPALNELAEFLRGVVARNPSLNAAHYREFLTTLLSPLGDDKTASILSLLGLSKTQSIYHQASAFSPNYKLKPPGNSEETDQVVQVVRQSYSLAQAWQATRSMLSAHEDYLRKSGDGYYFIRNLDRCTRALCEKYDLRDPEIQSRLFHWIHLALRLDGDDPRLWMLWELVLRKAGYPQRAHWVLWEMTRRFPDNLPCRVELARLLAASNIAEDQAQAYRLLQQVLELNSDDLYAHSTLAQLAIRNEDWQLALKHAKEGLRINASDSSSAVLLASAYVRRNSPQDLEAAIEHLQNFVSRNPGKMSAEDYLRKLLKRNQLAMRGEPMVYQDKEESASTVALPETDPGWQAFAESIRTWSSSINSADSISAENDDIFPNDRVLPLPQALKLVISQKRLDSDVLDNYEPDTQKEFPLETRLWNYLRTLQFGSLYDQDHAKQVLQAWLETEIRMSSRNNDSWLNYLRKHFDALNAPTDEALVAGMAWLKDLLDRYQPLPAPALV